MTPPALSIDICRNYIESNLFGPPVESGLAAAGEEVRVGVELECFSLIMDAQENIAPAKLFGKNISLFDTLAHFSKERGGKVRYSDHAAKEGTKGFFADAIDFPDGSSFQFEPGAQLEISTAPCSGIECVSEKIDSLQAILNEVSSNTDFRFVQCGTNPWFDVDAIGMQLNKNRYKAMARYFDSLNKYGRQMMLQTCSLQVNVDAGSCRDIRIKRFVAASLMAPFATAIFAHSPVIAGKDTGYKSYRSYIWQHLDTSRTGILNLDLASKKFSKELIVESYLQFALKAPVIYMEAFGEMVFDKSITLEYWMAHPVSGLSPSLDDFKNHLSLLFPEVRLKGYLELRSADAPPREWQIVPVLFYCSLLYSDSYLDKALDLLLPLAAELPSFMKKSAFGLDADDIYTTAKKLVVLAIEGFDFLPASFKEREAMQRAVLFFERFTMQRKTFADECLENFTGRKNFIAQ